MVLNAPPNWPEVLPVANADLEEHVTAAQDSTVFETDYTYEQFPQRIGDVEKHHYFQVWPIGVISGPQNAQTITPGLTVGTVQRIVAEKNPEIWLISVSSKAGAGSVNVYMGEPGGPFVPLGPGGFAVLPARGPILSLIGIGATVNGVVVGLANLDQGTPSPTVNVGAY